MGWGCSQGLTHSILFKSLVTESDFSNGTVDRATEKITKAFCMGHLALIIGNPNTIRFMTELGFRDWNEVLDRLMDAITDPATRFSAVIEQTLRQLARIREAPADWLAATSEVSCFNLQHASTGNFLRACQQRIDDVSIDEILAALH